MKGIALVVLMLVGSQVVSADPIANDPSGAATVFKSVVDTLSPQGDTLYNFWDENDDGGEWLRGLSIGIYKPTSNDITLGSIRLGYVGEDGDFSDARGWYTGINLDLPGLTKRYVPETVKGIGTTGYLGALWSIAGKYGRVGVNGGYDADRETPIAALSFGLSTSW